LQQQKTNSRCEKETNFKQQTARDVPSKASVMGEASCFLPIRSYTPGKSNAGAQSSHSWKFVEKLLLFASTLFLLRSVQKQ